MIKIHPETEWTDSMEGTQYHYYFYTVKDLTKICYRIFLHLKPRSWTGRLFEIDEDGNDLGMGVALVAPRDFNSASKINDVKKAAMEEVKILLQ